MLQYRGVYDAVILNFVTIITPARQLSHRVGHAAVHYSRVHRALQRLQRRAATPILVLCAACRCPDLHPHHHQLHPVI
jgi:hypothetical protein